MSGILPTWRRQKNTNRGKVVTEEWDAVDHLVDVAMRFKQAQIDKRPAVELIDQVDGPDVLFYVDPPYLKSTRRGHNAEYGHEMSREDHEALLDLLLRTEGMVALSGYTSPLYDAALRGWAKHTKSVTTNGQGSAVEALWLSPQLVERNYPLFASLETNP